MSVTYAPIKLKVSNDFIGSLNGACDTLVNCLPPLQDALIHDDPKQIVRLAESACGNTREVSHAADLAATLDPAILTRDSKSFDLANRAMQRAEALLQQASSTLRQLNDPQSALIAKYSASTSNRVRRLKALHEDKIVESYRVMLETANLGCDDTWLTVPSSFDGFALVACQWISHRLVWITTELNLESGPHLDALRKQLQFARQQDEVFGLINSQVIAEIAGSKEEVTKVIEQWIGSAYHLHCSIIERLGDLLENPEFEISEEDAIEVTAFLRDELSQFLIEFHQVIRNSSPSRLEAIDFDNVEVNDSELSFSRVLLAKEGGPKLWTAADLDERAVSFGNTHLEALESLNELIDLQRALGVGRTNRLSASTLEKWNKASPCKIVEFQDRFDVRVVAD